MAKEFNYYYTKQATGTLEVDDLGNCIIESSNDDGDFFYLFIDTHLGYSRILEYGPATSDFKDLPNFVMCSFSRIEYEEYKLEKRVTEFLNNPRRNITQAHIVEDKEEALKFCVPLLDYFRDENNY